MKRKAGLYTCIASVSLLLMCSCASTKVQNVWADEQYDGKIEKVLVIGITKSPGVRRMFEDEFSRQFRNYDIEAISSHILIPFEGQLNEETVALKVRDHAIDAVLVTRLLDEQRVSEFYPRGSFVVPGSYLDGYYNYYQSSIPISTGYKVEGQVLSLETNLYETNEDKLVWSALTKTFVQSRSDKEIKSVIKAMMNRLSDQEFFK